MARRSILSQLFRQSAGYVCSNFKVEREFGDWKKNLLSRLWFFCSHAAISFWFSLFFFGFLASGFLFACCFLTLIFCFFFKKFFIWFFRNGFSNSLVVRSMSSFLFSHWQFFEFYVKTCPAMLSLLRRIKIFRFTLVRSLFNILREIFLTSLGWFHSSLILLKVVLDRSCSAKQFKMKSQY